MMHSLFPVKDATGRLHWGARPGVSPGALASDRQAAFVACALFTDGRDPADPRSDGSARGWWGDLLATQKPGSLVWTVLESGQLEATSLQRLEHYIREALQPLIAAGLVPPIRSLVLNRRGPSGITGDTGGTGDAVRLDLSFETLDLPLQRIDF